MSSIAVIGHRGARALWPENTLEGLQAALATGVDWFEIDVGMTRDGVAVLSHDPRLLPDLARRHGDWLRTPSPWLHRMSWEELRRYEVGRIRPGSPAARAFPNQSAIDGARVPALRDVLRLPARWTIEIKTYPHRPHATAHPAAIAEAVAEAAAAAGARAVIQSFDWRGPRSLRQTRPQLDYAWLTTRSTRAWRGGQARLPEMVAAEGGGTWSPNHVELTQRLLERAKRAGLQVVPWTVNHPADQVRLAAWGVDGIITDDPAAARQVLLAAGQLRRPAAAP